MKRVWLGWLALLTAPLAPSCAHRAPAPVSPPVVTPSPAAASPTPHSTATTPDVSSVRAEDPFQGKQGCFLLYDVKGWKLIRQIGSNANCDRRLTACSTFKVAAALMAFDAGILKDENTRFKWDGRKWPIETWNQDVTAAEWMKYSVVWYTQRIMPQLGMERIRRYLHEFHYGNEDFGAGIQTAWLTIAPFMGDGPKGSLQISAREQAEFVRNLWAAKFPLSEKAYELTKKITLLETTSGGMRLNGKTGSGFTNTERTGRIGWFISHFEGPKGEYVAVTDFTDVVPKGSSGFAGLEAREITRTLLKAQGLWGEK